MSINEDIVLDWGQPFYHMLKPFIDMDMLESFMLYYKRNMAQNPTKPCKDAELFLRGLYQQQIPVVVLSSSLYELIEFDLEALGLFGMITQVFDSEVIEKPKPSPHALLLPINWLQKNLNVSPSQCIYVGDSLSDMECSRNQVDFFAVLSGSISRQTFLLNGLPENKIVENLGELYTILFSD